MKGISVWILGGDGLVQFFLSKVHQALEKLNAIVADAVKKYGANSVGVYVISFDEITPILIQSTLYENLGKVRWYGSDKIEQNHQITKNVDSALFAMKINLSNPLYSIDSESKKLHDLEEVLEKQLHEVSSITYPALAYDSLLDSRTKPW